MEIDLPFSGGVCQGYPTNRETLPDPCTLSLTHVHFISQEALPFFLKAHKTFHIYKLVSQFLLFLLLIFG